MIKGPYKIWETCILIISALLLLVSWIAASLSSMELPKKIAAVVFGAMALALFPRPIWFLAHIGKFTEQTEALAVKCVTESFGRTHRRHCTLRYSDNAGIAYEATSTSLAFAFSKEGNRYKIRYKRDDPTDLIVVPYAYAEAALFAFFGINIEALMILLFLFAAD